MMLLRWHDFIPRVTMTTITPSSRRAVRLIDLGRISYAKAWALQTKLHRAIVERKRQRDGQKHPLGERDYLLFCEHHPVYTLGKSGKREHLLWNVQQLAERGIEFYAINRGGDITYHGPGQLVVYPIWDLEHFKTDVHWYIRSLEEVIIRTVQEYGLQAKRLKGYTGVWIDGSPLRKICAIGVHLSRWVTLHGLAFNVQTNLQHFQGIIPCGIQDQDKTVTSLYEEIKQNIPMEVIKKHVQRHFEEVFQIKLTPTSMP